jgi:hypothetical protein
MDGTAMVKNLSKAIVPLRPQFGEPTPHSRRHERRLITMPRNVSDDIRIRRVIQIIVPRRLGRAALCLWRGGVVELPIRTTEGHGL